MRIALACLAALPAIVLAQGDFAGSYTAAECPSCAGWNAATPPVHLFANVYYVGTRGLSAVLITSPAGHVLIDAGLPESAPLIVKSISSLGFDVGDIALIANSHAHYDHAGGISALQRASGAVVAASPSGARDMAAGKAGPDDPQVDTALDFPPVATPIRTVGDGDTLMVGPIVITAHVTAGHTPGGTTWTWTSCDSARQCLGFVYADSQTPVSDDGFSFTRTTTYPSVLQDFERGFALLERLRCDVLLTPHPGASRLWQRLDGNADVPARGLRDPEACRRYAAGTRAALARRVDAERQK